MKILALRALALVGFVSLIAVPLAKAEVRELTKKVGGTTVQYKVVLPNGYDAANAYPAILAFGGGPQTMNTVDAVLTRNLRAEAEKRGYIVIGVAAPNGELFFEGGERIIPDFLKMMLADYRIQDGKFHVAGPSNGGIASFHVAAAYPQYFLSVTAFPGYMWQPTTARLQTISKLCVFMYVGERDEYMWHGEMQKEAEFLRSKGTVARYAVEKGQPHRIETLAGASASRLFDNFEETKKGCSQRTASADAQEPRNPRQQILAAARDVMVQARFSSLVTIGQDGHPQARIVDPLVPDDNFTVWISTNPLTRKVTEVERDERVTLLYFHAASASYVTLLGRATLVTDPAEKQKHWKDDWAPIYPRGAVSSDLMLIRVVPSRLEVVSDARGMVGDSKTWRPLAVDF